MPYPNVGFWSALDDGRRVPVGDGKHYVLSVIDCGFLVMPTGRLVACDPLAMLQKDNDLCLQVPPGRNRVLVTLADVSDANDGSHIREAYATLMLDETAAEAAGASSRHRWMARVHRRWTMTAPTTGFRWMQAPPVWWTRAQSTL
jgi:hypothetical protein